MRGGGKGKRSSCAPARTGGTGAAMPAAFAAGKGSAMDLVLNRFGHYFSIEGGRGGLSSTDWHFLPAPGTDREEAKAGMEAALGFHADMLDRLFTSVLLGKRTESLSDSPGQRTVGYRYRGSLTPWGALLARRRLGKLFGPEAARAEVRSLGIVYVEASVEWRQVRLQGRGGTIELKVSHHLGHAVNACMFRHLRTGRRFRVSAGAELRMSALEELLRKLETGKVPTDPRSLAGA